jgi:putative OPT family oligopeptide transporter
MITNDNQQKKKISRETADSSRHVEAPIVPSHVILPEITWRAIILGIVLTIVLAAANAYLGLKVGTTISASIPAAVISMGILRFFRDSNVLENTMVQTMASVGETLTAGIAFILPALIILRVWDSFHYWQTVLVGLLGGGLGVLFTIPLRRALLRDRTLRYPEGVAIANVLRASASHEQGDLRTLTAGGMVGAAIAWCQSGWQVLADNYQYWIATSSTVFGFSLGLSPALIAAGYIVGVNVALSLLVGIGIGWLAGVPILSFVYGLPAADNAMHMARMIWSTHICYIGIGTMLVGGLWTICTLVKPVISSIVASFASLRQIHLSEKVVVPRTERDIPIHYVLIGMLLLLLPIFCTIAYSIIPANKLITLEIRYFIAGFSTFYILVGGFIFCSVMAYFAGLIGSTNSPVSGLLISALLILCLLLVAFFNTQRGFNIEPSISILGAVVAIGSAVVIGAALSISNDTMQDLKVGQMVGATPWKQQLMLVCGVVAAAFVIPLILQLLYVAYGVGGVFPRSHMDPAQMLAAPQARLMASVAKGAFSHRLNWIMIGIGALVAAGCIVIDEMLKKVGTRLPVLAVGLGIYLPLESSIPFVIGGVLAYITQRRLARFYQCKPVERELKMQSHRHRGLLLVCGIVAGASLMGVLLAIPFAIKQSSDALKIMPDAYAAFSGMLGVVTTLALCVWIYRVVMKQPK